MSLDSATASSDSDKATLFNQFFYSVFQASQSGLYCHLVSTPTLVSYCRSISISDIDIYDALSSLHPFKAKGFDGIGPRILKSCALELYIPLHHPFCLSFMWFSAIGLVYPCHHTNLQVWRQIIGKKLQTYLSSTNCIKGL